MIDGHSAALYWLGAVRRQRVSILATETFGQIGDLPVLYRTCRLETTALVDAAADQFL